jgi:hypothetical protein
VKSAGTFADNKDVARTLREGSVEPALRSGEKVTLNFKGVEAATQSFMHALLSPLIRDRELDALDDLTFKSCSPEVQAIIEIVAMYSQDSLDDVE